MKSAQQLTMLLSPQLIAAIAHNVNRAYCESIGDSSQVDWVDASEGIQNSALNGVFAHQSKPDMTPEGSHQAWMEYKAAEGWVYGEVKDEAAKTHPCMVPYAELSQTQRSKDYLFKGVVHAMSRVQMHDNFMTAIVDFNKMYGLPIAEYPTTALEPVLERMTGFKKVITDEVNEVDEIIQAAKDGVPEIDQLVLIADWLCDIIVYASSECVRFGIPVRDVLAIIMASNASKLGDDGLPIIRDSKVQKGPNFWTPEPQIKELLQKLRGFKEPANDA